MHVLYIFGVYILFHALSVKKYTIYFTKKKFFSGKKTYEEEEVCIMSRILWTAADIYSL